MNEELAPLLLIVGAILVLIVMAAVKMALRRREMASESGPELEIKTPARFVQRPPQPVRQASQRTARVVTKDDPAARRR